MIATLRLSDYAVEIMVLIEKMEDWAAEHEGDITEFPLQDQLDQLTGGRDEKALQCAYAVKTLKREAEALAAEEKAIRQRRQAAENAAERLKRYIELSLPAGTKVKNEKASIHWSHTQVLDCVEDEIDPRSLPEEFQRVKVEADKVALKKALKDGREVEGFALATKEFIIIK